VGRVLWLALTPLAAAYAVGIGFRNLMYDIGLCRARRVAAPVLSVGNLTVGGTGKTPIVIWLAEELGRRGFQVGILSRGYRRQGRGVRVVGAEGQRLVAPEEAGDEPALMARRLSATVVVGSRRYTAARAAIRRGADVLLMDDGFQHRALARDFNVLLCDRQARPGDRWVLPAGRLREPRRGARRADATLVVQREGQVPDPSHTGDATNTDIRATPRFTATIGAQSLVLVDGAAWMERPLGIMSGQRVLAVCGIAGAKSFYDMLHAWEANIVGVLEFGDHHRYDRDDWRAITTAARDVDLIVTTEKDLVKLEQFPFAHGRLAALRLGVRVDDAEGLLSAVCAAIDGARSR
jgi:tetraacyldisaccharide 4'-kinase